MKTLPPAQPVAAAPILQAAVRPDEALAADRLAPARAAGEQGAAALAGERSAVPSDPQAPAADPAHEVVGRARDFAAPLLAGRLLDTGEDATAHADGVAAILQGIGAAPSMCAAAYLVYAGDFLSQPEEQVARLFGASEAALVAHTRKLVQIQRAAREAQVGAERRAEQTERVRKMLLAFSRDLRVVLLRLASRLQTLRWHAAAKVPCPVALAEESRQIFAPLANRLGIWQIKWELEDLAFRFLQPADYQALARLLAERRVAREAGVEQARQALARLLADAGIAAEVHGRPKHLYSIWKKMQGKALPLERVFDMQALRVVVADVPACYAALAQVHAHWQPVPGEYDDYIARPKANGYQSLHTVVRLPQADGPGTPGDLGGADAAGGAADPGKPSVLAAASRPVEIQIRTQAMHEHAEHGVAAHWAYKEAGVKGYAGVSAAGDFEDRVAEARKAVLRQLLAWERDFVDQASQASQASQAGPGPGVGEGPGTPGAPSFGDRIYVFTPQATVIELTAGATPIDFAYALHTDLGHRCRGARVDGAMLPLNTPLANGQTVEVIAAKEGGPSLDWLNADLGYLRSPRARSKVRAWFNTQAQAGTIARGREAVERLLQREGRTALKLDDLAAQLGFKGADALFEVVGKDEYSLRNIELLLRPPAAAEAATTVVDETITLKRTRATSGGVLVVGVDSLLTQLARCCRPAPPDDIQGYVTRGKGVAIHRSGCPNFRHMAQRDGDRVIPVAWGAPPADRDAAYPVDVVVEAADRPGLLRDISEVLAKERMNVTGVHTQSVRGPAGSTAYMTFTVEVRDALRLAAVLRQVAQVPGIRHARRR